MRTSFRALLFIAVTLSGQYAEAGTIDVSLLAQTLSGAPLDTLTFTGTVANAGPEDLFVNGATLSLMGFGPSDSDVFPFILNASGPISAGQSVGPVDFFTVTIPDSFSDGQYTGVLTVQGGMADSDDAVLATTSFQVNVQSTPEPASLLLTAVGLAMFVNRLHRSTLSRVATRPRVLSHAKSELHSECSPAGIHVEVRCRCVLGLRHFKSLG